MSLVSEISGRLPRTVNLAVLAVLLAVSVMAQTQESSPSQAGQSQPQIPVKKTVKQPARPLFRRHRRGVYIDTSGLPVIDATPQSPPLEIDDPGVPDKGEYEINLATRADFSRPRREFDFLFVDANYGILPSILGHKLPTQVKVEFPLSGANEAGEGMKVGIGAAEFGLKLNFYDNEHVGLFASFYPQIEF